METSEVVRCGKICAWVAAEGKLLRLGSGNLVVAEEAMVELSGSLTVMGGDFAGAELGAALVVRK